MYSHQYFTCRPVVTTIPYAVFTSPPPQKKTNYIHVCLSLANGSSFIHRLNFPFQYVTGNTSDATMRTCFTGIAFNNTWEYFSLWVKRKPTWCHLFYYFIQCSFNAQHVSAVNTTIFRSLRIIGCYFMGCICKKYRGIVLVCYL